MTVIGEAFIEVKPDSKGFGPETEKAVLSQASGIAKKVAGLMAGAFVVQQGTQFFKGALAEAEDARKVASLTEAVVKSTGGVANVSAESVDKLATKLSNLSGVDDEVIAGAENVLLTFTNVRNEIGAGNDVFDQAQTAALNMSAALGTDLQGATMQLGKALNDPVSGLTKLSRAGVQFTDEQKKQVEAMVAAGDTLGAQKIILGELETQFGGAAEAAASPLDRLNVAWGNLKETFGTAILPALGPLVTAISDVVTELQPVFEQLGSVVGDALSTIAPIIVEVLGPVLTTVADVFGNIVEAVGPPLAAVAGAFSEAFSTLGPVLADVAGVVAESFGSVVATLTPVIGIIGNLLEALLPIIGEVVADLASVFTETVGPLLTTLGPIVGDLLSTLSAAIGPVLTAIGSAVEALGPVLGTVASTLGEAFGTIVEALAPVLPVIGEIVAQLVGELAPVFGTIVEALAPLLPLFAQLVGQLVTALAPILPVIGDALASVAEMLAGALGQAIQTVVPLVTQLVSAIAPVATQLVGALAPIAETLSGALVSALGAIVPVLGQVLTAIAPVITTLVQQLAPVLPQIAQLIGTLATALAGALGQALTTLAPVLADVAGTVAQVLAGALQAIIPVIGTVVQAVAPLVAQLAESLAPILPVIAELLGTLLEALSPILEAVGPLVEVLGGALGEVLEALAPVLVQIGETLGEVLGTAIEALVPVITTLAEAIAPVVSTLVDALAPVLGTIGELFGTIASAVAPLLEALAPLIDLLGGVLKTVLEAVAPVLETIANLLGGAIKLAVEAITPIIEGLVGVFQRIVDFVGDLFSGDWSKAWETAKNFVSNAVDAVVGFVTGLPETIAGFVRTVFEKIGSIGQTILDGIGDAFSKVGDVAKRIVNAIIGFINDKVIGGINDLVQFEIAGISIDPPDIPKIPKLAYGDVINRPTLALFGEAGPEVVLPLSNRKRMIELLLAALGGAGGLTTVPALAAGAIIGANAPSGATGAFDLYHLVAAMLSRVGASFESLPLTTDGLVPSTAAQRDQLLDALRNAGAALTVLADGTVRVGLEAFASEAERLGTPIVSNGAGFSIDVRPAAVVRGVTDPQTAFGAPRLADPSEPSFPFERYRNYPAEFQRAVAAYRSPSDDLAAFAALLAGINFRTGTGYYGGVWFDQATGRVLGFSAVEDQDPVSSPAAAGFTLARDIVAAGIAKVGDVVSPELAARWRAETDRRAGIERVELSDIKRTDFGWSLPTQAKLDDLGRAMARAGWIVEQNRGPFENAGAAVAPGGRVVVPLAGVNVQGTEQTETTDVVLKQTDELRRAWSAMAAFDARFSAADAARITTANLTQFVQFLPYLVRQAVTAAGYLPSWFSPLRRSQLDAPAFLARLGVPQLADGGIISPRPGGTLVNVAEAGRAEAVVPLPAGFRPGDALAAAPGGSGRRIEFSEGSVQIVSTAPADTLASTFIEEVDLAVWQAD